jgi:hypothetical protein
LDAILKKALDKRTLEATGQYVVETIRDRVRQDGKGVKGPGTPTSKLKPLSEKWVARRKRSRLHPDTSPGTSNLTFSGRMLNALYWVIRNNILTVSIRPDQLKKAIYTNKDRPWVNLSKGEITKVTQFVERAVKQKLGL